MKNIFATGILLCFISTLSSVRAEESQSFSLNDIFQTAKKLDVSIRKSESRQTEQDEQRHLAQSNYYPSLIAQSTGFSNQLVLTQKVWDGGFASASVRLANSEKKIAEYNEHSNLRSLFHSVSEAYYYALFTTQKVMLLENSAKLVSDSIATAEKQMKYGAIGKNSLLRAKVAQRRTLSELFEANNQKTFYSRTLGRLTRTEHFNLNTLSERLNPSEIPIPPNYTSTDMIKIVGTHAPEIMTLNERQKVEVERKNITLAEDRLHISFVMSYGLGQNNPPKSIYPGYQTGFNLGAFISLPIFSGLSTQAKDAISHERVFQLRQDLNATEESIVFDTQQLLNSLTQDREDIKQTDLEINYAESIWKEVNTEYQAGLGNAELWFEALNNLNTWKIEQLSKTRDYLIHYAQLKDNLNEIE